jgi:hypothetical protein
VKTTGYAPGDLIFWPRPLFGQLDTIELRPTLSDSYRVDWLGSPLDYNIVFVTAWEPITIVSDETDDALRPWLTAPGYRLVRVLTPSHPQPFFLMLGDS